MDTLLTDWKKQLLTLAVFLFPILTATVQGAGSYIYGIILLMGLVYGWRGWTQLETGHKYFFIGLLVLFIWVALGVTYSAEARVGVAKLERYLRILTIIPVFLMFRRFDARLGKVFLYGAIVAIPVMAIQGWYQVDVLAKSVASGAYHKIVFGDMVILFASIVIVAALTLTSERKHYLLAGVLACVGIYAAMLSVTRASWFFVPILFVALVFLYRNSISRKSWMAILASVVVVVLAIVIVQPQKLTKGITTGISDIQGYIKDPSSATSWSARINMWRNALIMASESPVLGKGTGSYQAENRRLIEKNISDNKAIVIFGHAHSIFFHSLAENGITGLLVMSIVLFVLPLLYFYRYWQQSQTDEQRFYTLAGIVIVVAFAWFGVSEGWLSRNPFVNVYFMCMLVFMSGTASLFTKQENE